MAAPLGNSIEGLLALLSESDDSLKAYALEQINASVHHFWHQASGSLATIEALHEDVDFSHRELAALVASKVCGRGCGHWWVSGAGVQAVVVCVHYFRCGCALGFVRD